MDAPASPTNGKSGECETTQIFQDRISLLTVNPSYFTERHNYLLCGNFLDIYSVWSKFEKFSVYLACIERYEETFGIFVDDVLTFSGYHTHTNLSQYQEFFGISFRGKNCLNRLGM
jgi:hypothetical protein